MPLPRWQSCALPFNFNPNVLYELSIFSNSLFQLLIKRVMFLILNVTWCPEDSPPPNMFFKKGKRKHVPVKKSLGLREQNQTLTLFTKKGKKGDKGDVFLVPFNYPTIICFPAGHFLTLINAESLKEHLQPSLSKQCL